MPKYRMYLLMFLPLVIVACGTSALPTTPTLQTTAVHTTGAIVPAATLPGSTPQTPGTVTPVITITPATAAKGLLVQLPSREIVIVDRSGQATPFFTPDFQVAPGPYVTSGMAGSTLYAMSSQDPSGLRVYAIDTAGARPLDFLGDHVQSIAIGPGNSTQPASIAWGDADWQQTPPLSTLWIAPVDGVDAIKVAELSAPEGTYLVPFRFSADGQRLYYSQEPSGLGGYIVYGGFSSLFVYNQADNTSKELIPFSLTAVCIDDLSPDERLVAHHCAEDNGTSIVDLQAGTITSIALPPEVASEVRVTGSGRFSPDSQRLAYGLARRDPENEQGWVAVADDFSGASRLVATAPTGQVYNVMGWLDNNTMILQTYGETPVVWLLGLDGTSSQFDGTFLTLVDR